MLRKVKFNEVNEKPIHLKNNLQKKSKSDLDPLFWLFVRPQMNV